MRPRLTRGRNPKLNLLRKGTEMVAMRKRIKVRAKEILIKETTTETRNEMRGDPIESQRSLMQDSSKKVWHACTISSIVAFAIVSFIIICSVLYSYLTYLAYALIYSLVITYPPSCIDSYQHCYSYLHKLLCTFPFHITLISLAISLIIV